jgi:putative protease
LLEKRGEPVPVPFNPSLLPKVPEPSPLSLLKKTTALRIIARFSEIHQIPDDIRADLIFIPLDTPSGLIRSLSEKCPLGVEIPRGLFGMENTTLRQLEAAAAAGAKAALCGNIGAIPLAKQAGLYPVAGFGMNITNKYALEALTSRGIAAAVLSQGLTFGQLRFAHNADIPCGILAYGRQPLMLLRNCPFKSYKAAEGCKVCGGKGGLTDRRGTRFPLTCSGGCSELLNSTPLWLADKQDELSQFDFLLLHFTDETPEQVSCIISAYRNGGKPPADFTRGLYKRGVE